MKHTVKKDMIQSWLKYKYFYAQIVHITLYCIHYFLVLLITYHILSARQPTVCIASVFEEFAFQSILVWHLFSVGAGGSVGMRSENKKALHECINLFNHNRLRIKLYFY